MGAQISKVSKEMLHEKQLETVLKQKSKYVAKQLKTKEEREAILLRKIHLVKGTLAAEMRKLKHLHVELIHENIVVKRLEDLNLKRREDLLHMKQSLRELIDKIRKEDKKYMSIRRKMDVDWREKLIKIRTREKRVAQTWAHQITYWDRLLQVVRSRIARLKINLAQTNGKVRRVKVKYHQAIMSERAMRAQLKHVKRQKKHLSHRLEEERSKHKKLEHDRYKEKREAMIVVQYRQKVQALSKKVRKQKLVLAALKKQYQKDAKVQNLEQKYANQGLTFDQRALRVAHKAIRKTHREVRKLQRRIALVDAALAAIRKRRVRTFQQETYLI